MRLLVLISLLFALPSFAKAQETGCPASQLEPPQRLICMSLQRLKAASTSKTRFTRFKLEHNENIRNGHDIRDTHKLFEDLWINDLPYERLMEVEGKPLQGAELEAEQARYDKAVADRKALDMEARAQLMGGRVLNVDLDLDSVLSYAYRVHQITREQCSGAPCTHITLDPTGLPFNGKPAPVRRMEFWISDGEPLLLSVHYETLRDENERHRGSYGQVDWMLFDGVPVERHSLFYSKLQVGFFHSFTVRTESTYDRYRRFSTHVTIRPGTGDTPPEP